MTTKIGDALSADPGPDALRSLWYIAPLELRQKAVDAAARTRELQADTKSGASENDSTEEAHTLLPEAGIEDGLIAERVSFLLSSRESARDDVDRLTKERDVALAALEIAEDNLGEDR